MTRVELLQIITGFLGALGFAILYNIRGKKLFFAAIGGFFSWTLFVLLKFAMPNEALRYFIVAVTVSIYAEVMARMETYLGEFELHGTDNITVELEE